MGESVRAAVGPGGGREKGPAKAGKGDSESHVLPISYVSRDMTPPFQVFFERHREAVYRVLLATVGPAEADDCFQETFIAALRGYPRLDGRADHRAWVLTIAHRKAIDAHRKRARRPAPIAEVPEPVASGKADGPHAASEDALWAAVSSLPAKQKMAVGYRYFGGLRYRHIGAVMQTSEAAARRNVHEGIKKLREVFTQ